MQLCERDQWVGIAAIGIGTELLVSKIYQAILQGLRTYSKLSPIQRVFFDLHSACDDEHAAQLLTITKQLATDTTAREKIEYGVNAAITMRSLFWDDMLERAQAISTTTNDDTASIALGY